MKFILDNDLHIHSQISLCSNDPQQTKEEILRYALENDLKTICVTDHFWDEQVKTNNIIDFYKIQNYSHINKINPLPKAEGVRFLYGCETELNKDLVLGVSADHIKDFDFIVIPTTHFHFTGFTISNDIISPEDKAICWLQRFNAVLDMNLPFHKIGIAHLACSLIEKSHDKYVEVLKNIPEQGMKTVFKKAAEKGVGIELNAGDVIYVFEKFNKEEIDIIMRPFRIAKDVGCKFYCGSDAHHPTELKNAKNLFERGVDYLQLTENDKFKI